MNIEIRNEFAAVRLSVDRSGQAERLKIVDLNSGAETSVDAFLLYSLIWLVDDPQWVKQTCAASLPSEDA